MNHSSGYNTSTPDLALKFAAMNKANADYAKLARKTGRPERDSKEYIHAMNCYRAYWNAVDVAEGRPARDA